MRLPNPDLYPITPIQPKIKAVGFAAGITTVLMWLAGFFWPELMATAPTGLEAAITGIITTIAGWATRNPPPPPVIRPYHSDV
jgi:hypothetical protein